MLLCFRVDCLYYTMKRQNCKDNTALFAEHNGFQQKCPFFCGKGIAYVSSFSKIDKIVSHSCWDLLLPKYPTVYRREPESADF